MKIIHVYPQLNLGGTETVIYNLVSHLDRAEFDIDILAARPGQFDDKFRQIGIDVKYIDDSDKGSYCNRLRAFFEQGAYDVVHAHTHAAMDTVLKAARKAGVPVRVAHSHNDRPDLNALLRFLHSLKVRPIAANANVLLACSAEAASWLFPWHKSSAEVLLNGIDLNKFGFDTQKRSAARAELGIAPDEKIVLFVGRLAEQKNPLFAVETASKLPRGWRMLLIGDGPLRHQVDNHVQSLGCSDKLILAGARTDVDRFYSAADAFVLPSLHEGLGIVAIEAQTAGLPSFVSTGVPVLADLGTGLFNRTATDSAARWADMIASSQLDDEQRKNLSTAALSSKYNIEKVAERLSCIYRTCSEK